TCALPILGTASCVQLHHRAMGGLVERLESEQATARLRRAVDVLIRHAKLCERLKRLGRLTPQTHSFVREPLIERAGTRIEAVEQIAAIQLRRFLKRRSRRRFERLTEAREVADERVGVERE